MLYIFKNKQVKLNWVSLNFIIVVLISSCTSSNPQGKLQDYHWIGFEWVGATIEKKYYDKLAITIPFKIEGVPHQFKSQFDLGAPSTMLYGNSIKPYMQKYNLLSESIDTLTETKISKGSNIGVLNSINFKLDTVLFKDKTVEYYKNFGTKLTEDSVNTNTIKHIGTIGADLFQNKFLIIDFPNQRIAVTDSLNSFYSTHTTFVNARLDKGRIKVPVTVNNEIHYFMFDTGSSMFPLMVTKKDLHNFNKTEVATDTVITTSWGQKYGVTEFELNYGISIGNHLLNNSGNSVYVNPLEGFSQFFDEEGIIGIMGNKFFLNNKVIIDYKNKRFGILSEKH